jgi:1-phosphatidylinositol-3-phosphate 5-kinase
MANDKPLPEPPAQMMGPTTLSIDARLHRARLLRHIFDDIEEPGIQNKKDGWVYAFEEALDELAGAVDGGGWIPALKQARAVKDDQGKVVTVEEKTSGGKDEVGQEVLEKEEPKPTPLERLQQRSQATSSAGEGPKHLVLCVASHGILGHHGGFDNITTSTSCVFAVDSFAFDKPDGSNVLFGLDGMHPTVLIGNDIDQRV